VALESFHACRRSRSGPIGGDFFMMHKDLLNILVCPMDRTPLTLADGDLLKKINKAIAAGEVSNHAGRVISEPIEAGLIRQDGHYLYPVVDDIPLLLADEAIPLR
jgi:uncharacterized protein